MTFFGRKSDLSADKVSSHFRRHLTVRKNLQKMKMVKVVVQQQPKPEAEPEPKLKDRESKETLELESKKTSLHSLLAGQKHMSRTLANSLIPIKRATSVRTLHR